MRLIRRIKRLMRESVYVTWNLAGKPNPHPLLVYGNQKSGTSAVAALLAEATGKSVTLDLLTMPRSLKATEKAISKKIPVVDFINAHKFEFSREIVKEPGLTMLFDELDTFYNHPPAVFVIRDPRDNIRSILNKLGLPGNLPETPDLSSLKEAWRKNINHYGRIPEGVRHYIEKMAWRWNDFATTARKCHDKVVLIQYEDFIKDKKKCIEELAGRLGFAVVNDISSRMDRQFQPKGDRSTAWIEFFGPENLKKIENICKENMLHFGYPLRARG